MAKDKNKQGDQTPPTPPVSDEGQQGDQTPPTPPAPTLSKFAAKCKEIAQRYAKSYPQCPAFHFCADMQVFLAGDLKEAQAHQAEIDGGEVITINID